MSKEKEKTVTQIIAEACAAICDNYCKYPVIMDAEEWVESYLDICDKCPLCRLME